MFVSLTIKHKQSEIKAIVSRRKESEYLLHRIAPRKSDYKRFIEAERNLEKLRALRKKMVFARYEAKQREKQQNKGENNNDDEGDKGKGKPKSSFGDESIIQYIHLLFIRAKRKWKEDLSWHLQHAEFAKEAKSHQMLSRIYAEALQIHPRNESLWIEAASHEYFGYTDSNQKDDDDDDDDTTGGGSIKSARVLLQRGLRINPQAQNLWLQSFCLELHYIQKLRGRREILNLQNQTNQNADDNCREDEEIDMEELDNNLKLPHIIYRNAIKSIPSDVSFRMFFVEQCKLFPKTEALVKFIMDSIEEDFQKIEEAWIARAQFLVDNDHTNETNKGFMLCNKPTTDDESVDNASRKRKRKNLSDSDAIDQKVVQTLSDAVDTVQTPEMFIESLDFLREYIAKLSDMIDEDDEHDATKKRMSKMISATIRLINSAESAIVVTPTLAIEMANILHELGLSDQSFQLIKRLTNESTECKKSAHCWLKIVEISEQLDMDESETKTIKSSIKLLQKALKIIPMHDSGYIQILLKIFQNFLELAPRGNYDDELFSTYEKILLLFKQNDTGKISFPALALKYLLYVINNKDMNMVRKVYQKLLFNSNCSKNLLRDNSDSNVMQVYFDKCLEIETIDLKSKHKDSDKRQTHRVKNLYKAASRFFQLYDDGLACSYLQRQNEVVI